jgi:hypothetical protein
MRKFNPEKDLKTELEIDVIKSLPDGFIYDKVVLGIDIYKYSQYPPVEQIYIPVIFETLYIETVYNISQHEKFIFNNYCSDKREFKKKFISTGDGGFQIFDNEIQAIVFALYFQMLLKRYCTGGSRSVVTKNLYKVVEHIELRFAISREKIYSYKSNYFGPAIINNARILSKDSLNRLLIDSNSVQWLNHKINSPENLLDIDKSSFLKTSCAGEFDENEDSWVFEKSGKIISLDLQKVGTIKAKETEIDVLNMHIQAKLELAIDHHEYNTYVITVGNLNTSGIN